jgi:hypothetical protein
MISAFGVDHGEVSKAFGSNITRLGSKLGSATSRAGTNLVGRGVANKGAARAMGKPMTGAMRGFQRGLGVGGSAQGAVGGRLQRAGAGMMKRPGLTGSLAVGGAGAGGGAALLGNRQRRTF